LGLVLVNGPLMVALVRVGIYEWWMLILSAVAIIFYFAAMKLHYIEGADFMYCMWISLFLIYNPVSGHWLMVLPFMIFLACTLVITMFWICTYNFVTGVKPMFYYAGGVPLMFPISAALVLTVMLA
jgi:hypothetical protein